MVTKEDFAFRDLVSIDDFSFDEINYVIDFAREIKNNPFRYSYSLRGKLMAPLFFEPSTRTSSSFQAAILKMGGSVLDFDVYSSSIQKGETLRDTVKTIEGYSPDFIVIRHKKDGATRFVSDLLNIPVINAGDGKNQHPTQTLLDLYTINEILGKIDGAKIAIAGDLKYGRTPHSLALALSKYAGCELIFVSPESLKMPADILEKLNKNGCIFSEESLKNFKEVIESCDLVYMTRVQRERFPEGPEGENEYNKVSKEYFLSLDMLKNVKPGFKIMHPLPKISEIDDKIDDSKFAYYFNQAKNGIYIRQALLFLLGGINHE